MAESDPFREQRKQEDESNDNQPALRMPKVDRQRDMGSGLVAGTDIGFGAENLLQNEGGMSVGPGADPHGGAGDGRNIATGQFLGSDDGTTTEQDAGVNTEDNRDNQQTDLARKQQSGADYRPEKSKE
jgi:hypothetical protein